jgi:hypothetical protein
MMEPHGQSPCLHAEVPAFTGMLCASRRFACLREAASAKAGHAGVVFYVGG